VVFEHLRIISKCNYKVTVVHALYSEIAPMSFILAVQKLFNKETRTTHYDPCSFI
jgi:hypothetical protein